MVENNRKTIKKTAMRFISILFSLIIASNKVFPMDEALNKAVPRSTWGAKKWNGTKRVWNGTMWVLDSTALVIGRVVTLGLFAYVGFGCVYWARLRLWQLICDSVQKKATWLYRGCLESHSARSGRIMSDFLDDDIFEGYRKWARGRETPLALPCAREDHQNCSCLSEIMKKNFTSFIRFLAIAPVNYQAFGLWINYLDKMKLKDSYLKKIFNEETIRYLCIIRNDQVWTNYIVPLAQKDQKIRERCQEIVDENPACRFNWFKRLTVNSLAAINHH